MNNKKSIDELIESIFILVNEAKNKSIQLNVSKNSNYQLKKAHEISQNLVELPEIFNESKKNNVLTEKNTVGKKIHEKSKKTANKNNDLIHQSNVGIDASHHPPPLITEGHPSSPPYGKFLRSQYSPAPLGLGRKEHRNQTTPHLRRQSEQPPDDC